MKTSVVLILLCVSFTVFSQKLKVKEKDNMWLVNDKVYVQQGCKWVTEGPCVFSSPSGDKKYFSLVPYKYRATRTRYGQGGYKYNEEYDAYYYHVKFLTVDKSFYTTNYPKQLIENMYNGKIINDSGDIDVEKLDEYIKIYSEEPPVRVSSMD